MNLYVIKLRNRFALFKGSNSSVDEILYNENDADRFNLYIEDAVKVNELDSFSQRLVLKKYFRKVLKHD